MLSWWRFFRENKRMMSFGFIFNFFSSFGQTFFISLFVPFWVSTYAISNAQFGSVYAAVTVVSAFLISIVGKYIDRMPLYKYALIVYVGLLFSLLVLAKSEGVVGLFIGLFLVRWVGQGMMSHTATTGVAKFFLNNRGKALSITSLGHASAQLILPILVVAVVGFSSWSSSLWIIGLMSLVFVLPSLQLIKLYKWPINTKTEETVVQSKSPNILRTKLFWIVSANVFIIPFLCTAVFLYQYGISQSKGWDDAWVVFSFMFYAVANFVSIVWAGDLVDRFSGKTLFPLYLIPAIIAVLLLAVFDSKFVFPLFYLLLGVSSGMGNTIKTALQAELYGVGDLGKIRSYFSTILILSTALGPPLFGFFIDKQYSFATIMYFNAFVLFAIFLLSFKVWKEPSAY